MNTLVFVNTYTHSVTYVTDKILLSLFRIIKWSGLDPIKLTSDWGVLETGLKRWLETKHLTGVVLEVYSPFSGTLVGRWDFDIEYSLGIGDDGAFWVDTDAIRFSIAKCGLNPDHCDYRIVATTKPGRPDVPGWSPTTLRSTDGLVRHSIGTTIGAGSLGSRINYWRKTA
ncbi:MAG: HORMA domain containing protein [Elusimicrobia bacterium]|nr:HORMA domain containing protein [Elusimicrobiota bacterium]